MQDEIRLYTDGGARGNPGPAAYAFVICKLDDTVVEKSGKYIGETTNNQAEYQALEAGLTRLIELRTKSVDARMDSELIVKQVNGLYKVKNAELLPIYMRIKEMVREFDSFSLAHVPRAMNSVADAEVNRILDEQAKQ